LLLAHGGDVDRLEWRRQIGQHIAPVHRRTKARETAGRRRQPAANGRLYVSAGVGVGHDAAGQFYGAAARDYVDNAFTVRVPFFGVAFDVNDLGLLVGIGFVVILLLLRFSLGSEIVGLRISFKNVTALSQEPGELLERFYELLAMRQVFTLPQLKVENLSIEHHGAEEWSSHQPNWSVWILRIILKFICCLPFFVYSIVAWHDLQSTALIGKSIDPDHMKVLVIYTATFWVTIFMLTLWHF